MGNAIIQVDCHLAIEYVRRTMIRRKGQSHFERDDGLWAASKGASAAVRFDSEGRMSQGHVTR